MAVRVEPATVSALGVTLANEAISMGRTIADDIGMAVERATGCQILDEDGRLLLDFTAGSGALALGHGNPVAMAAMREQMERFVHGGWQLTCRARAELTTLLCATAPLADPAVLLTVTGGEAVEAALKMARAATGRRQVFGFLGGYHGKTGGALTVTANAAYRQHVIDLPVASLALPYPPAVGFVEAAHQDERGSNSHDFGQDILEHPDFGIDEVAAIIVEPVQGSSGMIAAAPGFLRQLREFTYQHGILLIVDEIYTGFGRTGRMWAVEHEGVVPDILVAGKAMGGGLPVAGVLAARDVADAVGPLQQTSTFSGNPVACAAGAATVREIQRLELAERAETLGARLVEQLRAVDVPDTEVRVAGRGLMVGVVLGAPGEQVPSVFAHAVVQEMRARGTLVLRGGHAGNVIKFTPPLTIEDEHISRAVGDFSDAIAAVTGRQ